MIVRYNKTREEYIILAEDLSKLATEPSSDRLAKWNKNTCTSIQSRLSEEARKCDSFILGLCLYAIIRYS